MTFPSIHLCGTVNFRFMGDLHPISLLIGRDNFESDNPSEVNIMDYIDEDSVATIPLSSSSVRSDKGKWA